MTFSTKDLLNGNEQGVRPTANNNPANTMRKYQQLALAAVSVISLMAFLFYKHEYDRLHYTLEYLEMFGSPPDEDGLAASQSCGSNVYRRLRSAPASWIKVSNDLVVYSAFWDEGNGYVTPVIRTIAIVKKSTEQRLELTALIRYEGNPTITTCSCSVEKIKERTHVTLSKSNNNDLMLVYLVCGPKKNILKSPLAVQFQIGRHPPSPLLQVQESESWKSVVNATAICAFSSSLTSTTRDLIEFLAFYHTIGVEKFTFFGPVLTPVARKILDKYGDESGIFYEEEVFNVPNEFTLNDDQMRSIVEKDCIFRHRDTYENILILQINQFLIPRNKGSIQGILNTVSDSESKSSSAFVSEFHFQTQRICVDSSHTKPSDLLLDSQVRIVSSMKEEGLALIRPHFSAGLFGAKNVILANEQHIPASIAIVLNFENCFDQELHEDDDHLPSIARLAKQIRNSLLYRKWKVNM